MRIYKLLSLLLEYPDRELLDHLPEIRVRLDAMAADAEELVALRRFLGYLESRPLIELQEGYVRTFDFSAEHSLHLTHHLFGDDKNRGPALIDLGELYRDYGVETVGNELPDYLPLVLEFAAQLDEGEASVFLSDAQKVFDVLANNLSKADSPYAGLLTIIAGRASLARLTV